MSNDGGLSSFQRRMRAVPKSAREAVTPSLMKSAEEVAGAMKRLAESSRDSGALIDSIEVTGPGQQTPPYSQPGGQRVVGELEAAITVGNAEVRYPHLVEHGTKNAPAQPFFWPGFRLSRKRALNRIKRAIGKAIKEAR